MKVEDLKVVAGYYYISDGKQEVRVGEKPLSKDDDLQEMLDGNGFDAPEEIVGEEVDFGSSSFESNAYMMYIPGILVMFMLLTEVNGLFGRIGLIFFIILSGYKILHSEVISQ